jgi:hypothetical protein
VEANTAPALRNTEPVEAKSTTGYGGRAILVLIQECM